MSKILIYTTSNTYSELGSIWTCCEYTQQYVLLLLLLLLLNVL